MIFLFLPRPGSPWKADTANGRKIFGWLMKWKDGTRIRQPAKKFVFFICILTTGCPALNIGCVNKRRSQRLAFSLFHMLEDVLMNLSVPNDPFMPLTAGIPGTKPQTNRLLKKGKILCIEKERRHVPTKSGSWHPL